MKYILPKVLIIFLLTLNISFAQVEEWRYTQRLYFPPEDSLIVRPYLSTLASDGTLWVISSRLLDVNAHNAIYKLAPGDTVFTKFIDFSENGDSDTLTGNIGFLRGITVLGNTLYIVATQPYPKTQPNTVSATYLYPNFDTTQVIKYGFGIQGSGYGSYNHGAAISKDSILFTGISFGTTFRCYNFSYGWTSVGYGSYVPPPQYVMEPGGPDQGGKSFIRDVALIPNANYADTTVPFYTSRNSISSTQLTGGIAKWINGSQYDPQTYDPFRVEDFDFFLQFIDPYPYGIDVDENGLLWVAGIDSTRRWVKAFEIDGINALEVYDLPSQFSEDIPDPNGAPMTSPCDVSIGPSASTAYVIDMWSRAAFKFEKQLISVEDKYNGILDYSLEQNYPNPFNPSTMIRFTLQNQSNVKLIVTDVLGNEVATIVDENLPAGKYTKSFNASNLPSGVYFYSLITDNFKQTRKMLLLR
ncbi:T9SS type A sorting domain-containing protein [Ignavibacterium sp.]|uniref:T9SS type A sorting domain-containing protein n=1 Tax=Ignavibacterium sp. TaxID=2651167 RepID=UPI0021FF0953|nr:T9SS type A sorting domain-containing protein [Ignavibacterium sp.]BDQ04468.1 MAG: hypothetical protein KatS3mg037_3043 [Ignavibacterium sp.]